MVGGGFYALLGKVAGEAGMATPIALGLSGLLAFFSGLSFAELSSRFPYSAGEAYYVREGFGRISASTVVGWLVVATGVVSSGTLTVATVGFLQDRFPLPFVPTIAVVALLLGLVAAIGVNQSVGVVATITVIEVAAIFYVIGSNAGQFADLPARGAELVPGAGAWLGIFAGGFLAFYAYIGFEDMVNMAEEVRQVRRNLPVAIVVSIVLATLLYIVAGLVAVLSVPLDRLEASATPIRELVGGQGWMASEGIWAVSLLTGVNGALVQIVMASRVLYGLASQGQAPLWMGRVNPVTRTPVRSTALVTAVILALALFFPLTGLARVTSFVILLVFAAVNLALWQIKGRDPEPGEEVFRVCRCWPMTGFLLTVAVLGFQVWLTVLG